MVQAFVFHGIAGCVTHLYIRNNEQQNSRTPINMVSI